MEKTGVDCSECSGQGGHQPTCTPEDFVLDEVTHPFARATIHPSAFDKDGPRVAERERQSREMTIQLSYETQVGCECPVQLWNWTDAA